MKIYQEPLQKIKDTLLECLQNVPSLKVRKTTIEPTGPDRGVDLIAEVETPHGPQWLLVEFKTNGQPLMARGAVHQLARHLQNKPNTYGLFAAPYISKAAAEICTKDGIGYLDLSGNCRLVFDQVYIERSGQPNRFAEKRDLRSLFSDKATRVLRVLLENPKKAWKTQALAKEAQVSLGQVANVKKLLENREWTGEGAGLSLTQPEALLREWADVYSHRRNEVKQYYSMRGFPEMEGLLHEAHQRRGLRCPLTGFSAAAFYHPFTRYETESAYADDLVLTAAVLNLKEVESGGNFTLIRPSDEGVYYRTRDFAGTQVVSPIQTYLDLSLSKARGKEAAEALLNEVIRRLW